MTGSAGQLRVPEEFLASLPFPIAPVPEQRRIVEEIEKQFTRLDAGVAALKRVEANLRRYKAAVLKAAVEGRLTERWRAEHRDVEPASELLKRILTERRRRWEQSELAKMQAKGKRPTDDRWKKKYKEPTAPDTDSLPPLPNGWIWATVGQLGEVKLGRQRSPKNRSDKFPTKYIRAANLTWSGLDLTDVLDMEFRPSERMVYRLRPGDILLAEASGSANQVGKPAIWNGEIEECCFQNTVIRFRSEGPLPQYLVIVFLYFALSNVFADASPGVGIHHLGAARFGNLWVPLPPLAEQQMIVSEVEERLSLLAASQDAVTTGLHRANSLRQSILKRAFEGKLVPQDPTDEPASALLDRIRAEKAKLPTSPGRRVERKRRGKGQKTKGGKDVTKGPLTAS